MTAEKEYLIYLISCFLSGTKPEGRKVKWEEIFRLADINDIGAVIATEIKMLPEEYRPEGEVKSRFNQLIGYAVRNFEIKQGAFNKLCVFLDGNNLDRLFVKGSVINAYYPVPELRTSGDIDVIVRREDYKRLCDVLKGDCSEFGITPEDITPMTALFRIDGVLIEIHREADVLSSYFDDIFSVAAGDGHLFRLDDYNHLLYVICHLSKHLKEKGAGIRMAMDADVIIRHIKGFDLQRFLLLAEKAEIKKTAESVLSFCKYYFNTPVDCKADNTKLYESLCSIMLEGGSFGNVTGKNGLIHLNNAGVNGKINGAAKFKTLLRFAFPPADYVREYYNYSVEHKSLVPLAYVNRIFDAAFKRRGTSLNTVKEIRNLSDEDSALSEILGELGLN